MIKPRSLFAIPVVLCALVLGACSSGSDNDDTGPSFVTYNGPLTRASLDQTNAAGLIIGSMETFNPAELVFANVNVLLTVVDDFGSATSNFVFCDSPGSFANTGNSMRGSYSFDDACVVDEESGLTVVLNGTAHYEEEGDVTTVKMSDFELSVNGNVIVFDTTVIKNGTVSLSVDLMADDGRVYRVENFLTSRVGDARLLSLRFYHPDYGYVDIATPAESPLLYSQADCGNVALPYSGSLLVSAGNQTASLNFQSCTEYMICLDATNTNTCTSGTWSIN